MSVRKHTSPDLCLIESGIHPVQNVIASRRRKFLESKLSVPNNEEPFHIAYELCREANTPGYRSVTQALRYEGISSPQEEINRKVREKPPSASKYVAYRTIIYPQLSVHPVYTSTEFVPHYMRQTLTRLRLMSHDLEIETGRRNGTPVELRQCSCDENVVQDESHVLDCVLSRDCRTRYNTLDFCNVNALMERDEVKDLYS